MQEIPGTTRRVGEVELRVPRRLRRKLTIIVLGLATVCTGLVCKYFPWPAAAAVIGICAPGVAAVAAEKIGLAKAGKGDPE